MLYRLIALSSGGLAGKKYRCAAGMLISRTGSSLGEGAVRLTGIDAGKTVLSLPSDETRLFYAPIPESAKVNQGRMAVKSHPALHCCRLI